MSDPPELYAQYHISKGDERLQLFEILRDAYAVQSCLYPGCFVHVTPAFTFPRVAFVDTDRRARTFFEDLQTTVFVESRKQYAETPEISFFAQDYAEELPIGSDFDLLLSQYAGFVSEKSKRYLRRGGLLVANDSHGDASLASLDRDFRFVAAINRSGDRFWFSRSPLDEYFVPKRKVDVTRELLYGTRRGVGYTRSAADYVFE